MERNLVKIKLKRVAEWPRPCPPPENTIKIQRVKELLLVLEYRAGVQFEIMVKLRFKI